MAAHPISSSDEGGGQNPAYRPSGAIFVVASGAKQSSRTFWIASSLRSSQ
jgi:hypothetical protein